MKSHVYVNKRSTKKLHAASMKYRSMSAKRLWKISRKERVYASKAEAAIYAMCYSIHSLMMSTIRFKKSFINFQQTKVFYLKIKSGTLLETPFLYSS